VDNVEITVCFRHFPVEQVNRTSWVPGVVAHDVTCFLICQKKKLISVFMCESAFKEKDNVKIFVY